MAAAASPAPFLDNAWNREVSGEHFHNDLQRNLKDLESLASRGQEIDPEFIKIFTRDLDLLNARYQSKPVASPSRHISELHQMRADLQRISTKIGQIQRGAVSGKGSGYGFTSQFDGREIPLVCPIGSPLAVLTGDKSPASQQTDRSLRLLEQCQFRIRRVQGNGHCLFSSVAAQLLTVDRLSALKDKVPALLRGGLISSDSVPMIDYCLGKLRSGASVESLLQDPRVYNAWVSLLRRISTGYWRSLLNDPATRDKAITNLAPTAKHAMQDLDPLPNDQACVRYLDRIAQMSRAPAVSGGEPIVEYGGSAEILALGVVLGIPICVVDATTALTESFLKALNPQNIFLLYRNIHYDALYLPGQ